MSKKVVFFLADLQSGGTEWFALRLARGLKRRGYSPLFITGRAEGDLFPLCRKEFEIIPIKSKGYHLLGLLRSLPEMVRFLKTIKPEILISGLPLLNAMASLAVVLAKVPTKLIVVEHMRVKKTSSFFLDPKEKLKRILIWWTHYLSDAFVCVSDVVRDDLASRPNAEINKKLSVIYNPIIPDDFEENAPLPAQDPWLIEASGPVLISVGRLLPVKNYPLLIEAFGLFLKTCPNARLMILGDGQEREKLAALIKQKDLQNHVRLAGSVENVFPYLCAADLFVLSSSSEAFGNVIVEALACGVPVVSTDCGGPREILKNGRYGYLAPNNDAEKLALAMQRQLTVPHNPELLKEYGRSFSVAAATQTYQNLIETLLKN